MKLALAFLFLSVVAQLEAKKSYSGYKVLRTEGLTPAQVAPLNELDNAGLFDFWKSPRPGVSADIMTPNRSMKKLTKFLEKHNIKYSTWIEDVEENIKAAEPKTSARKMNKDLDWNDYYGHDTLNAFIDGLADQYDWINTVSIGKSFEGRDMRVIQLAKAGAGKPNVWIEAGIHAREWIAPAMGTYLINELVKGEDNDFLDHLNVHVLPSANPDGYEYSRNSDRMWRKTRSDNADSLFGCKGVDGNRNWGFHFGESGTSSNPCSDTFKGPEAFSEVEMRNIRDYVLAMEPVPILAHTLHSYSQLWLYPYGYGYDALPENWQEIKALGEEAVEALKSVHGTVFDPINSADLYPAAGASDDWYKGVANARFAYTTELRDTGRYGFVLPPDQIIPSGEELWAAFKVVFNKMISLSEE